MKVIFNHFQEVFFSKDLSAIDLKEEDHQPVELTNNYQLPPKRFVNCIIQKCLILFPSTDPVK